MSNLSNLGIDIDGTITSPYEMLQYMQRDFDATLEEEDFTEYDLSFLNKDEEILRNWFLSIEEELYNNAKPVENAQSIMKYLTDNYNVHLITARPKKWKDTTIQWLSENDIKYDTLDVIGSHNKVQTAKDRNVELFIEDNLINALYLNENLNIPILLIDTEYNQSYLPKGITRVKDWNEILDFIKFYEKNEV